MTLKKRNEPILNVNVVIFFAVIALIVCLIFVHKLQDKMQRYNYYDKNQPVLPIDSYMMLKILKHYETISYAPGIRNYTYVNFLRLYNQSFFDEKSFKYERKDYYDADALFMAIFCDKINYTQEDFERLLSFRVGDSMYKDTHIYLALILLQRNHCLSDQDFNVSVDAMENMSYDFFEANDRYFRNKKSEFKDRDNSWMDIFAERIVFLYWANRGDLVKDEWIRDMGLMQQNDLGWRDSAFDYFDFTQDIGITTTPLVPGTFFNVSNPHTTGLVKLSIDYHNHCCDVRDCFPWNDSSRIGMRGPC